MTRLIAIIIALCFVPSLSYAQHSAETKSLLDIQRVVSPKHGITAWLVEDHSVPVLALHFVFKDAGALNDPEDKQGLARMVSNTMDEGAGDLESKDFQTTLNDQSISLSFGAERDHFYGQVRTLSRYQDQAFDLLRLALTEPRFDEAPFARMRASNQSRIRSSLAKPEWIAARILNDKAFEGHRYARNSGGTLSSLEAITPEDARAFHAAYIGRNNLVVSVAGDITAQDLGPLLDQIFADLPEVNVSVTAQNLTLQNAGKSFAYTQDIPQSIVRIMQDGIDVHDPDYQIAKVMNYILGASGFGSRLMSEMREKRGLTYGVYSSLQDMKYFEGLQVSFSTNAANIDEAREIVQTEWQRMIDEPISQEELETAQSYLIGSLPLSLTSTNAIAGTLLSLQMDDLPIDYLDQREAAIRAVSVGDIQAMATRILTPSQMLTILVGPEPHGDASVVEELPNVH